MWQCPNCNNEIESGFGMVQCPKCQTYLFVDVNGNIIVGGADETSTLENEKVSELDINSFSNQENTSANQNFSSNSNQDNFEVEPENSEPLIDSENNFPDYGHEDQNLITYNDEQLNIDEQAQYSGVTEVENLPPFQSDPTRINIEQVKANLDAEPALQDGTIFYRIIIEGIDSSDLRNTVLNTLNDKRLGLVNDEISENIINGNLLIQGLNPIKAHFITNALKDSFLNIKWELYVENNIT